ncbi:MAG: YceI family protein [Achromobacter sp.]|uniref:YceI family protein n=1 Tax=Achromobacter sp. TaxID=134375 RepID=UPI001ACFA9EB|nr:YceI family protein [Achromobacter sp.]MBN9636898.1 YceI family protein [Achromobacter sp.]
MRKTVLVLAALGVLLGAASVRSASNEAPEWSFDPPHCSVLFFVKHILADIPGRFDSFSGVVRFDPENLAGSRIDVTVDIASIDTGVPKRDEHLKSKDFFNAASFPSMRFVSKEIAVLGGGRYVAKGSMTIKDVTLPVEIPFEFLGVVTSPMEKGKQVAGFRARFALDMLDYHVSDGGFKKMGVMGSQVDILMNLELLR